MIYFVVFCLFFGISIYLLLGGADYGAGVLELFTPARKREYHQHVTYKAIGPIWEANHVWLILALVIIFVGFPGLNLAVMTHLHIPLTLVLLGIIGRGTAFVFKHYDAVKDGSQKVYDRIYTYSSIFTPFFLGVVAGGVWSGKIDSQATTFQSAYIEPWLNPFALSVGVFTVAICAFLAAAYLIGEGEDGDETHITRFKRKAQFANLAVIAAGGLVLLSAGSQFALDFITGIGGIGILVSSVGVVAFWWLLKQRYFIWGCIMAAFQVVSILLFVSIFKWSDLIEGQSLMELAASDGTINALGGALIAGLLLIGPAFVYLYTVFKRPA